jgi:hypothetical protein
VNIPPWASKFLLEALQSPDSSLVEALGHMGCL